MTKNKQQTAVTSGKTKKQGKSTKSNSKLIKTIISRPPPKDGKPILNGLAVSFATDGSKTTERHLKNFVLTKLQFVPNNENGVYETSVDLLYKVYFDHATENSVQPMDIVNWSKKLGAYLMAFLNIDLIRVRRQSGLCFQDIYCPEVALFESHSVEGDADGFINDDTNG